ncbi:branched-chain amino acid ABC transporter permease (plasmid) [Natrinema zhouii]|uniref:branched-chain amino acid ABC transporter permease n=1 Tax=Natrinema zhouii TaxID=1710539 RepID=UPI001CFF6C7E|nr:branched-chain amino acid ABC transporter permease [Natrinema zhouii]UHQ98791.1 branched-chain amino acid ABC transporter permease [Natrinema zhouii]
MVGSERDRGSFIRAMLGNRRRVVIAVGIVLAFATIPFVTERWLTQVFFTVLVFVILGVSWDIIGGYAGQISLGHVAFFGFGAYVSAWLTTPTRAGFPEWIQSPVIVAVLGGALVAGLLALVVGPVMFRLTGHYFAIGTLALAAIIELILSNERSVSGGSSGYFVDSGSAEYQQLFLLTLAVTVVTVIVSYYVVTSRWGLAMRAIHDDETAASSLGINPLKYKLVAFSIASGMAGMAGGLYAQYTGYLNPADVLGLHWMVEALVVVVLGGMGTITGPILGAGLFVGLDWVLGEVASGYSTAIEGLLIILFMLYMPKGIYGLITSRTGDTSEEDPPNDTVPTPDESATD